MINSCYWLINPEWYFCLSTSAPEDIKIFGFAEFLAALALLVIVFTTADARYKFRTAITPLPIYGLTFFVIGTVGLGTLLTELWSTEGWYIIQNNIISRGVWAATLGLTFLLTLLIWLWFAFISPPKFNKWNAEKFAREIYKAILRSNETELGIISDELERSVGNLIRYTYTNYERINLEKNGKPGDVTKGCAYDLLLLIANKKFCSSLIKNSSGTAIKILHEIIIQHRQDIPIGNFIVNLSSEAISNKNSLLHDELTSDQYDFISYTKPLSNALFGNFLLIKELGKNHCSPLDINYFARADWSSSNWKAYCQVSVLAISSYLDKTKGNEFSSEIYRAFVRIKSALSDLHKLNGRTDDFYNTEIYERFQSVINFINDLKKLLENHEGSIVYRLRLKSSFQNKDIYDLVAELMFDLIQAGSNIKGPIWTAWGIQHNSIWSTCFESFSASKTEKILKFKLRRLIYDEVKQIPGMPNYLNAKILGLCLNVMGLKERQASYAKGYRPLHKAILKLTTDHYRWLSVNYPEIAEEVLIGGISFNLMNYQLVKTYTQGIGQKTPNTETLQV